LGSTEPVIQSYSSAALEKLLIYKKSDDKPLLTPDSMDMNLLGSLL